MAAEDVFGIVGTVQAGNFHVEKVVAEGGFGVVYRAHHGGFRAPVAVKCLKIPEQMSTLQRDAFLEKFREEAELMFRLSAAIAEVCRPLHVDVLHLADGRFVPFLAMEWLEGESLDALVTRRREQGLPPLGLQKVMKMMRPVAVALARAHRCPGPQGVMAIIHRDLKPENLMVASVGGTESMKILDFGIAKAKRAASQAAGRVTGHNVAEDETASFTPAYGAPEQWTPKSWGETGPWTDVWGLALTMVEALSGTPPIDGEPWAMRRICLDEKRRPTPRNQGAEIPLAVDKVFEQALAVDPRQRFKTIEAFWSELEKAMGLPPSMGPRDDRREPGEQHRGTEDPRSVSSAKPQLGGADEPRPAASLKGERLARIEPKKLNVQAAQVRGSRPLITPSIAAALPALAASVASPTPKPPGRPVASPPAPAVRRGEPSTGLELDLDEPPSSRPRRPPADLEMRLPGDSHRPTGTPLSAVQPAPAPLPPPARASMDLEMDLPSRSDRPPASSSRGASLEMSLPTPSNPPPPPSVRRPTVTPLPAVAPSIATQRAADRRSSGFDLRTEAPFTGTAAPAPPPAGGFNPSLGAARSPERPLGPPRRAAEGYDLRERLRAPVGILLAALTVACLEVAFHRITGSQLMLGPVRPFWIAAPLALFGVGFTLWRLMEDRTDD